MPDSVSDEQSAGGYDPRYFPLLAAVEDRHFWFVVRRAIIFEALQRSVPDLDARGLFDIGCGSGGLLAYLQRRGVKVNGACDAYLESLEIVRRRMKLPLVLVDEGRLPPLAPGHGLLTLFDVLEHLDDDREMLRFLWSVLEPGGVLVLTVPAHPFLFDDRDELAQHRRRYRRRDLREKLEAAGFEVEELTHFMAGLVPPLLAGRGVAQLLPWRWRRHRDRHTLELRVVPGLNGRLRGRLGLERSFLRWGSLPFGSSILAVARRPGARDDHAR